MGEGRYMDRLIDKWLGRYVDGQMKTRTYRQKDMCTVESMRSLMDGSASSPVDEWVEGCMNGWTH
jgi:hypothetical protein